MQAVGLDPDAQDHWEAAGLSKHNPPAQDLIEARRRAFQSAWSACDRSKSSPADLVLGKAACTDMEAAFDACQDEWPEIVRTLRNRKAGMQSIPKWHELSTIVLEWALKSMPTDICIALHLSDLQKADLNTTKFNASTPTPSAPRLQSVDDNRILYGKLSKGEDKIKEALREFKGGGVLIWVPDDKTQFTRLLNALE